MSVKITDEVQIELLRALEISGLTQNQLAARLKCDKSRVAHVLHGNKNMTLKTLDKVAKAMGFRVIVSITK